MTPKSYPNPDPWNLQIIPYRAKGICRCDYVQDLGEILQVGPEKKDRQGTRPEDSDLITEAEAGAMHFGDRGEARSQRTQAACRSWKRQGNDSSPALPEGTSRASNLTLVHWNSLKASGHKALSLW